MQMFVSNEDVNLRLRYYIQQEGNWSYCESNAEITESCTEVDVLCLDEETEELTKENPDILEEFVPGKMNDISLIECIIRYRMMSFFHHLVRQAELILIMLQIRYPQSRRSHKNL